MQLVPFSYNLRSLLVRRSTTLLTVVSIGATVAVISGVQALQQGFVTIFEKGGRTDVVVFLRPGATTENQSAFTRSSANILLKSIPEIALTDDGRPLASAENYMAVRLFKIGGGETNVPVRGVQPMTMTIRADDLRILEGRTFQPGADEIIVGENLTRRIRGCQLGEVIRLNTVPFTVVGIFTDEGTFSSEIWGDLERMGDALQRSVYNRVIGVVRPDVDIAALIEAQENHPQVPAKVMTEADYLMAQTGVISTTLLALGAFLAIIMGIAAVFTTATTMQAALAARTHEIGILACLGFRPLAIMLSFLFESLVLGLLGGLVGILLTLPLNGIETGTTNMMTFTEVAFAFRITPQVLGTAIIFSLLLGLLGGAVPAFHAARMSAVEALRRA
jgi:ABC-type antimicrobial peptide transport system permease subunit